MKVLNRRGEEYVEAAIVLPLVILTILSMIMIAVFLYRHLESKSEAHIALMRDAASSENVFGIKRRSTASSSFIRGTFSKNVARSDSLRAYELKQADAIRIGGLIN